MNTSETFSLLFNKNQNTAYKALKILQKESEHTDHVYPFFGYNDRYARQQSVLYSDKSFNIDCLQCQMGQRK